MPERCPDCLKRPGGCTIRLKHTEPEIQQNPRCRPCALKAGLDVVPESYHRRFWEWLKS